MADDKNFEMVTVDQDAIPSSKEGSVEVVKQNNSNGTPQKTVLEVCLPQAKPNPPANGF